MKYWYLYVVECNDGTFYTGITTDIKRRLHEHNNTKKGAKYTRRKRPVTLICILETFETQSLATKKEYEFKQLSRKQKEAEIRKRNVSKI
jgi:putative endonuclease